VELDVRQMHRQAFGGTDGRQGRVHAARDAEVAAVDVDRMWDAQLQVGCATRTIDETLDLARKDGTVFTTTLYPRLLTGSGVLFHEFGVRQRRELMKNPARFIEDQQALNRERHAEFGDSLYLLQPNIKDGQGTLRDYHTAYWVMQVTEQSGRRVEEFLHLGLLTQSEVYELIAALDFLWRVRNELHRMAGRKNDQMSFEIQEQVAVALGYGGDGDAELPVERLMRDFYRHARAIGNYSSLVIEQCLARVRGIPRRRRVKMVEHGFRIANEQLEIPHGRLTVVTGVSGSGSCATPPSICSTPSRSRSSTTSRSRARRADWFARTWA